VKFASTLFLFEAYLGDAEYQKYRLRGVAKGAALNTRSIAYAV